MAATFTWGLASSRPLVLFIHLLARPARGGFTEVRIIYTRTVVHTVEGLTVMGLHYTRKRRKQTQRSEVAAVNREG